MNNEFYRELADIGGDVSDALMGHLPHDTMTYRESLLFRLHEMAFQLSLGLKSQEEKNDAIRGQFLRMLNLPAISSWEAIYDEVKLLKGI